MEITGDLPIEPLSVEQRLAEVIRQVWMGTVTVQSNFARDQQAVYIAACASEGFITTRIGSGLFSRQWLVTPVGLEYLQDHNPSIEF